MPLTALLFGLTAMILMVMTRAAEMRGGFYSNPSQHSENDDSEPKVRISRAGNTEGLNGGIYVYYELKGNGQTPARCVATSLDLNKCLAYVDGAWKWQRE